MALRQRVEALNTTIKTLVCRDTLYKLSDEYLLPEYKKTKSVSLALHGLENVLVNNEIEPEKIEKIKNDYVIDIIPPGTKGVVRGYIFNRIVMEHIINMKLTEVEYDVAFEKYHPLCSTHERPDWYIYNKVTNKVMIGMNQLDLWGGGHQLNRGSKYIIDCKHNTENSKLVCVVANSAQIRTNRSKVFKLFDIGLSNNTLCYITNLQKIIYDYFDIEVGTYNPTIIMPISD